MDMHYKLKEDVLTCKKCNHPFTFDDEIGFKEYNNVTVGVYSAICIGCGKEIQINIEIRNFVLK
jgi:RNase P subunit RPR2